jgi:hypothetical protein
MHDVVSRHPGANQDTEQILARRPQVAVTYTSGRTVTQDRKLLEAGVLEHVGETPEVDSGAVIWPPEHN